MQTNCISVITFPYIIREGKLKACNTSMLKLECEHNLIIDDYGSDNTIIVGKLHGRDREKFDNGIDLSDEEVIYLTFKDVLWAYVMRIPIHDQTNDPYNNIVEELVAEQNQSVSNTDITASPLPTILTTSKPEVIISSLTTDQTEAKRVVDVLFESHMKLSSKLTWAEHLTLLVGAITQYLEINDYDSD